MIAINYSGDTASTDSNAADMNCTAATSNESAGNFWIAITDFTTPFLNAFDRIDQLIRSRNWAPAPREIKPRINAPGEKRILWTRFTSREWTGFNFRKQS